MVFVLEELFWFPWLPVLPLSSKYLYLKINELKKNNVILLFIIQTILNIKLYKLTDSKFLDEQKSHFEGKLVFQGDLHSSDYERTEFANSTFEKELISTLKLNIECDEIIYIKVTDLNKKSNNR